MSIIIFTFTILSLLCGCETKNTPRKTQKLFIPFRSMQENETNSVIEKEFLYVSIKSDDQLSIDTEERQIRRFLDLHPEYPLEITQIPLHFRTNNRATFLRSMYLDSNTQRLDLFSIDVVYPGDLNDALLDIYDYVPKTHPVLTKFNPEFISNNERHGRLVALPLFQDYGMLYYRKDLLELSGFHKPPQTWEELEEMAFVIQRDERERRRQQGIVEAEVMKFWGFGFQGDAYEGLTCNFMEWFGSHGILITDPPKRVSLEPDNEEAIKILNLVKSWIGKIVSPEVTNWSEDRTADAWLRGELAFARNWPYMMLLSNNDESECLISRMPKSQVKGKFGVTALPSKPNHPKKGTLGGWGIAINRNTPYPKEAVQLALFLTSTRELIHGYREKLFSPAISRLLNNPDLCNASMSIDDLVWSTWGDDDPDEVIYNHLNKAKRHTKSQKSHKEHMPQGGRIQNKRFVSMKSDFGNAPDIQICDIEEIPTPITRPSTEFSPFYTESSSVIFNIVHSVLENKISAEAAIEGISCGLHILIYGKVNRNSSDFSDSRDTFEWDKYSLEKHYPSNCPCSYLHLHGVPTFIYPNRCSTVSETFSSVFVILLIVGTIAVGIFLLRFSNYLSYIYRHTILRLRSQKKLEQVEVADPSDILSRQLYRQFFIQLCLMVTHTIDLVTDWFVLIETLDSERDAEYIRARASALSHASTTNLTISEFNEEDWVVEFLMDNRDYISFDINLWPFLVVIVVLSTVTTIWGMFVRLNMMRRIWFELKRGIRVQVNHYQSHYLHSLNSSMDQNPKETNAEKKQKSEENGPGEVTQIEPVPFQAKVKINEISKNDYLNQGRHRHSVYPVNPNLNKQDFLTAEPKRIHFASLPLSDETKTHKLAQTNTNNKSSAQESKAMISAYCVQVRISQIIRRKRTIYISLLGFALQDLPMTICNVILLFRFGFSFSVLFSVGATLFMAGMHLRSIEVLQCLEEEARELE